MQRSGFLELKDVFVELEIKKEKNEKRKKEKREKIHKMIQKDILIERLLLRYYLLYYGLSLLFLLNSH